MLDSNDFEVLTAAAAQVNRWLITTMDRADLRLRLVDETTVRRDVMAFVAGIEARRKVAHWNWLEFFHKKVKYRNAWMFAIDSSRGAIRPMALCWGKLEKRAPGHVSIGYIERRPFAHLGGLTAKIAFQFVLLVAAGLKLERVLIANPFPELVRYYTTPLGVVRHPTTGGSKVSVQEGPTMSRYKFIAENVVVSREVANRVAAAAARLMFTRDQALAAAAAEPRGVTVYAGLIEPIAPKQRQRGTAVKASNTKRSTKTASRDKPAVATR